MYLFWTISSALSVDCMETCWRDGWKVQQGLRWWYKDSDQDNLSTISAWREEMPRSQYQNRAMQHITVPKTPQKSFRSAAENNMSW